MDEQAWTTDLRRLAPAAFVVTMVGLLGLSIGHGTIESVLAPLVLLSGILAYSHRKLLSWDSLLATLVFVIYFIPIKRYTLPSQLPFNLEPYRVFIVLIAVAWFVSLLIDPRVRARRSGLEGPIGLFMLAAVASAAVNDQRIHADGVTSEVVKALTFFASFFVIFYVVVSLVRTRHQIDRFIRFLVGSGTVVSVASIIEARTSYNVFNHLGNAMPFLTFRDPTVLGLSTGTLDRAGRLRVYASAEHPIELSAVLVMLVPLAFYLAKSTGRRRWFAAAGLLGIGAVGTVSRTGVVMMVVIGLVFLWLRSADVKRLLPLLVPALCVVYFMLPHTLGSFYAAFFPKGGIVADQSAVVQGNNLGADGRLADIRPSIREWSQRPLFGEGFGSRIVSRADAIALNVPRARLLDDQWLGTLLETGIVGVTALLWLFIRAVRRCARVAREDDGDVGWLGAALAASLLAFAIGMLTFDALGFVQVTITFFLLLALSSAVWNHQKENAGQVTAP